VSLISREPGGTRQDSSLVTLVTNREKLRNECYSEARRTTKDNPCRGLSEFLHCFYLRAAISDCLLIGFIRAEPILARRIETLNTYCNLQYLLKYQLLKGDTTKSWQHLRKRCEDLKLLRSLISMTWPEAREVEILSF
jgi:hypothetical protein